MAGREVTALDVLVYVPCTELFFEDRDPTSILRALVASEHMLVKWWSQETESVGDGQRGGIEVERMRSFCAILSVFSKRTGLHFYSCLPGLGIISPWEAL